MQIVLVQISFSVPCIPLEQHSLQDLREERFRRNQLHEADGNLQIEVGKNKATEETQKRGHFQIQRPQRKVSTTREHKLSSVVAKNLPSLKNLGATKWASHIRYSV